MIVNTSRKNPGFFYLQLNTQMFKTPIFQIQHTQHSYKQIIPKIELNFISWLKFEMQVGLLPTIVRVAKISIYQQIMNVRKC